MDGVLFRDRDDAGRRLAAAVGELVLKHPEMSAPVVLALPRGGVPVARPIARALSAPLDLLLVRKIGLPSQPELAAAAVVDGHEPQLVVNRDVVRQAGLSEADLEEGMRRELAVIERRRRDWLSGRAPVSVSGRDAIVVDDGVATGATTRAALRGLRLRDPRSITLAVPVAPRSTLGELAADVDHLVCLATPEPFYAIGQHYLDFSQVSDADVVRLLTKARR